jgi:DNA repair protein RecO (recombination protein O)
VIRRIDSAALLVRSVPYGESDVVATFFTEETGKLSAIVRGARKSTRRFTGALEPIHELIVAIEDKGKELCVLKEARIRRARTGITTSLEAMEASGHALRWIRHLCPARTPEPGAWRSLDALLDALDGECVERGAVDARAGAISSRRHLAVFGLRLLTDVGYALELERCIRCARPCPEGRSAFVDAGAGGVICTSCGGARRTITGELRALAVRAQRGEPIELAWETASGLVDVVEEAMAVHAGFDRNVPSG